MGVANSWKGRLGIDTADPVTKMIEFNTESIKVVETIEDQSGTRGTLSMPDARTRITRSYIDGSFETNPTPTELDNLIQLATGATKVDNTTAMVPTFPIPSFYATIDRETKVFKYTGNKIETLSLSANSGGPLKANVTFKGISESIGNAGTFPSIAPSETAPYILSDLVMQIGGTSYAVNAFKLDFMHELEMYFANSVTPTRINQTKLTAVWALELPYGDAAAIYGASNSSAVVCIATFTNGNVSFKCQSNLVKAPRETPVIGGNRGELPLTWTGVARISTTYPNIVEFTNDSTP